MFIKQVFYGTQRYENFIRVFTDALFKTHASSTNRNDHLLYSIFIYILCFRFDELPFHELKKLI